MAQTYSASDLASLLRQFGQLSLYTVEMGGDIAFFEMAMRIPPWESLRPLTAEEIRRFGISNAAAAPDKGTVKSAASNVASASAPRSREASADTGKASSWEIVDRGGVAIQTGKHPLKANGEVLGHFEINFACAGKDTLNVAYSEVRRIDEDSAERLTGVGIFVPTFVPSGLR